VKREKHLNGEKGINAAFDRVQKSALGGRENGRGIVRGEGIRASPIEEGHHSANYEQETYNPQINVPLQAWKRGAERDRR